MSSLQPLGPPERGRRRQHLFSCFGPQLLDLEGLSLSFDVSFQNSRVLLGTPNHTGRSASFPLPLRGTLPPCDVLRGSPLEQHPFPRLQGTWVTRGMQASKARMSPCGRSAPGSACDVNRHLDKHKPSVWFFFQLHCSLSKPQSYLLRPHHRKRPLCCRGPGRAGLSSSDTQAAGASAPALSSRGGHCSGPFISCPHSAPHGRFPGVPSSPLCAQAEWALGAEGNLPAKVSWHSGLRLGASATLFHRLGFRPLRFL